MHRFLHRLKKRFSRRGREINPEEIFLDSANLPGLNRDRFEGRIERPIGEGTLLGIRIFFVVMIVFLTGKLFGLQILHGEIYTKVSEANSLERTILFADRGVIYDRNGLSLAENAVKPGESDFASRTYSKLDGLSAVVGFVRYPQRDSAGHFYDESYHGQAGVEKVYDTVLSGLNGAKLIETDALGGVTSESVVEAPRNGQALKLSLDARVTQELYQDIAFVAKERGFSGGAGVIVDVTTGEILALTSYPEYDANVVTEGSDTKEITRLLTSKDKPFLNRAVSGLYTPGSIVKPIMALGALGENIIDPTKQILSTGKLVLPNPYDPENPSIFRDWKAHGWVDMRAAIAVSSDVYFYEVGGGFEDQIGLGISKIDKYLTQFGLAQTTGIDLPNEAIGYIATPIWKEKNFPDDPDWRIGDTYHTVIGQYGTQVTPVAAARWTSAIANGGKLPELSVVLGGKRITQNIDIPNDDWTVVREGMRQAVTNGIASALYFPQVAVAAKSGTAELGTTKSAVNSWITGFFPYKEPRYAFAVVMEHGPAVNTVGATYVMNRTLSWMINNTPEYLK